MAVIGVSSTNDRHPANVIYNKNYHRYPIKVFPVNTRGAVFQGQEVLTSVSDIPHKIDLAIIAVRAEYVYDILLQCIKAEVKSAAIISGGFAEVGNKEIQERIVTMAREADFPFIGPNCLGIYVPERVDTFFIPSERMVRPNPGKVALISQSGGILVDQMLKFSEEGIGLSTAVSIGNKALINELHLLR
jgi:acetyltransferase